MSGFREDIINSTFLAVGVLLGGLSPLPVLQTLGTALLGYWGITWLNERRPL